jgi:dolichyl-phosphate beta-glucosyltransferase
VVETIEFSLVIPAYNEANRILPTLRRAAEFLDGMGISHEIIVVDDGSADGTLALCRDFASRHDEIRVLDYPSNRGKGYAVRMGMLSAGGSIVAFSDADMPVPPDDYARFIKTLKQGADLVIGSRYLPSARWDMPVGRKVIGWGFRMVVRFMIGSRVSDTQFGFKMFSARAAKDLFSSLTIDGFAFDAELVRMAQLRGFRIAEVPVRGVNAPGSKVRPAQDAAEMMWQLMLIRLRSLRYREPVSAATKYSGSSTTRG